MIKMIVITGPSGVGKTTLVDSVLERDSRFRLLLSHTDREPRPGEKNGTDYHFNSTEEFERMIENNMFLEWKKVYGDYKGIAFSEFDKASEQGHVLIKAIDVHGALDLKDRMRDKLVTIYVTVPSLETILVRNPGEERLTDERVKTFHQEEALAPKFDHIIMNRDLQEAMRDLELILKEYL